MASPTGDALTPHLVARTWLRDRDRQIWPWLDAGELERLNASLGAGPDPLVGEEPVAALYGVGETRGGVLGGLAALNSALNPLVWISRATASDDTDWNRCALITDERLVVRDGLDVIDAPFTEIHQPEGSGWPGAIVGTDALNLVIEGETQRVGIPGHHALRRFLQVTCDEARAGRIAVQRIAPPFAGGADPSGALGFIARMEVRDERAVALLELVADATASGRLADWEALDLAQRVVLHHRATVSGRGSHGGLWVSALRRAELIAFFEAAVGWPDHEESVGGLDCVVLRRDLEHARTAPGSVLFPPASKVPKALPDADLRLLLTERHHPTGGDHTAYQLDIRVPGVWQPMPVLESRSLARIHEGMLAFEAQILLRRALYGAEATVDELLGKAPSEVERLLGERAPKAALRWFIRPRNWTKLQRRVRALPSRRGLDASAIPSHLPPPATALTPVHVGVIALANALAAIFTFTALSTTYCFGGISFLMWAEQALLAQIPGLDEEMTTAVLLLLLIGQWGALLVTSPLRFVGALLVAAVPRASGLVGWSLVALGLLGLLVADIPGFLAAVVTATALTRRPMREYLTS